ncbi:acylneuraminate cytidylyltransferase family protein [Dyadobacter sandarakinus]|uniref:Acylneuraminate cytidylyltransferase family protein n=1 Tax=Dyadobacter sandarakinus TaxID=2747268 RepID=A0ABX7IAV7_9BACT|nr:acylneuraminate cytidylyltransferase family protein [Dyadobacter sandarakinus]QRR03241.1 acylneuraminate cytidylyltransferase family protein [Dyadobacter sandarakinus]
MHTPKVLGIIPARKQSREVPGKNSKLLNNKPLVSYTIETALQSQLLDTILVSTDSSEILEISRSYDKVETPFTRPAHLATDLIPSIAVVQHALDYYEATGQIFDFICLLQPTVPFRSDRIIDRSIEEIVKCSADSLITVAPIPAKYNPLWAYRLDEHTIRPLVPESAGVFRRQDLPPFFCRNGSVYITSAYLIKEGLITGGKMAVLMDEHENHVNIDSLADWKVAEQIALTFNENA